MTMTSLLEVCGGGDASRRAADELDAEGAALCRAIRRALPFVVKRGMAVRALPAEVASAADAVRSLAGPSFSTALSCESGARGLVAFDGTAVAMMLDGVLGGDGHSLPELRPDGLTPPQAALAARVADAVGRAVADRINARFGLTLRPDAARRDAAADAVFLVVRVEIGEPAGETKGVLLFALPRTLVPHRVAAVDFRKQDPAVVSVLSEVEIELVVELGRVTVPLARLLSLQVGETLLSDVPVTTAVSVRADDIALFEGRPTASAGRFAVRVDRKIG